MKISVRLSKAEVLAKLTLLERCGLISDFQFQPVSIMKREQRAALKIIKFLITEASGGFFSHWWCFQNTYKWPTASTLVWKGWQISVPDLCSVAAASADATCQSYFLTSLSLSWALLWRSVGSVVLILSSANARHHRKKHLMSFLPHLLRRVIPATCLDLFAQGEKRRLGSLITR